MTPAAPEPTEVAVGCQPLALPLSALVATRCHPPNYPKTKKNTTTWLRPFTIGHVWPTRLYGVAVCGLSTLIGPMGNKHPDDDP